MNTRIAHSNNQNDREIKPVPLCDIRDAILDGRDEGCDPEFCLDDEFDIPARRFAHPSWIPDTRQSEEKEPEHMNDEMVRMWPEWNRSECNILDDPLVRIEIDGEMHILLRCTGTNETDAEMFFISADQIDESVA